MEKPTWVKVIGVLAIIFGCTGILGSIQLMFTPWMFDLQQDIMDIAMDEARRDPEFPDRMADKISSIWNLPAWFDTWAVVFGLAGLAVAVFYLLAAIRFIQVKPGADRILMWALGVSMLLAVLQAVTIVTAGSFMAIMFTAGAAFSLVIDLVLMVVIATSDRSLFNAGPGLGPQAQ